MPRRMDAKVRQSKIFVNFLVGNFRGPPTKLVTGLMLCFPKHSHSTGAETLTQVTFVEALASKGQYFLAEMIS